MDRPDYRPPLRRSGSITNMLIAGTLESPATFTKLLILNSILMGVMIGLMWSMISTSHDFNTRLMLLSNDARDIESVLISRGYAKPSDFTKPSDVGQHP